MLERRFFIATTVEEFIKVTNRCYLIGRLSEGNVYHDYSTQNHDLWYLDESQFDEGEKEKYESYKKQTSIGEIPVEDTWISRHYSLQKQKRTEKKRFCELDDEIEDWSDDEKNFVLCQLLRDYAGRLAIPENPATLEEHKLMTFNHNLWVDRAELIDILKYELWRQ